MLIDRQTDYALRTLLFLAENREKRQTTGELSKQLRISYAFLAKILPKLAKAGMVKTEKGKGGGVWLASDKVSLLVVIELFGGKHRFNRCLAGATCFLKTKCPLHKTLAKLQDEFSRQLAGITLAKILARKGKKQ